MSSSASRPKRPAAGRRSAQTLGLGARRSHASPTFFEPGASESKKVQRRAAPPAPSRNSTTGARGTVTLGGELRSQGCNSRGLSNLVSGSCARGRPALSASAVQAQEKKSPLQLASPERQPSNRGLTLHSSGPTRAGRATPRCYCRFRAAYPCGPLNSNVRRHRTQ